MKYQAKPVIVDAFIVTSVSKIHGDGSMGIGLQDGTVRTASRPMISRYIPVEGDYWVVQEDGYEYLNPKDVFERKYTPFADGA